MTEMEKCDRQLRAEYALVYDAIESTVNRLPSLQESVEDLIALLMRLSFELGKYYTILEQKQFDGGGDEE